MFGVVAVSGCAGWKITFVFVTLTVRPRSLYASEKSIKGLHKHASEALSEACGSISWLHHVVSSDVHGININMAVDYVSTDVNHISELAQTSKEPWAHGLNKSIYRIAI